MMRHLSVWKQNERERERGVPCYLGNSDDVMGKVEPSSDWLGVVLPFQREEEEGEEGDDRAKAGV